MKNKILALIRFFGENFGPYLVFLLFFRIAGYKIGTLTSMVIAVVEFFWLRKQGKQPGTLFIFSSIICLLFGTLDLFLDGSLFQILEAPITNFFISALFALSLREEKSLVQLFAEENHNLKLLDPNDKKFFFHFFTAAWSVYFSLKALAYLWINLHLNRSDAFLIRLIIGNVTFFIFLGISIFLGGPIWTIFRKLRLLPSCR